MLEPWPVGEPRLDWTVANGKYVPTKVKEKLFQAASQQTKPGMSTRGDERVISSVKVKMETPPWL